MRIHLKRRAKYGNVRVRCGDYTFDSRKEYRRYLELLALRSTGSITGLVVHPSWEIRVNGKKVCRYVADFSYLCGGRTVVEDVKGVRTAVYRLKKKLMAAVHGVTVEEI